VTAFTVKKLGYSRGPWRIVGPDGEIQFEQHPSTIHGQDQMLDVFGYDTKAEAVEALGRLAYACHQAYLNVVEGDR